MASAAANRLRGDRGDELLPPPNEEPRYSGAGFFLEGLMVIGRRRRLMRSTLPAPHRNPAGGSCMICTPVGCQSELLSTLKSYHQRQPRAAENRPKYGRTTGKCPHLLIWEGGRVTGHLGKPSKAFAGRSHGRNPARRRFAAKYRNGTFMQTGDFRFGSKRGSIPPRFYRIYNEYPDVHRHEEQMI